MLVLALDTCFGSCSAALYDGVRVVASHRQFMERGHAEALPPIVDGLLREARLSMRAVTAIAVTIGPGTFTGLRIGLAFAQGLAVPHGLKIIPITSLQAVAAPLLHKGRRIVVCHRAGASGLFYVQKFDEGGEMLTAPALLQPEHIAVDPDEVLIGTGASSLTHQAHRAPEFDLPNAAQFAAFAASMPASEAHTVQPLYMREADAKPAVLPLRLQRVGADQATLLGALHEQAFESAWSAGDFSTLLESPGALALLAMRGDVPCGFLLLRAIAGEAEVLTLAVAPPFRRKGVALALMQGAHAYLLALQSSVLHLEVNEKNEAAVKLYRRVGFAESGRRRGYYALSSGETADAILMRRALS
jgi:tRNA threonylcarbamoyl adenosine modification protein YeaZ